MKQAETAAVARNAVIYARYSSHSQTEQSIEGQLRVCHEYAQLKDLPLWGNTLTAPYPAKRTIGRTFSA